MRKNTVQVLTHLILKNMLKVKGHISEMATCIVDHNDRIAGLAKLFFHELAKKVIFLILRLVFVSNSYFMYNFFLNFCREMLCTM